MPTNVADCPMSLFDLTGRRALVTGAWRGIGRAIALAFAAQGAKVAVHHAGTAHEARDAEAVVAEVEGRNGTARAFAADFAQRGAAGGLAECIGQELGPMDILVLNASIELLEENEDFSDATFDRQIDLNLRAPLQLVQALLPGMRARGWGRVLTIGRHPAASAASADVDLRRHESGPTQLGAQSCPAYRRRGRHREQPCARHDLDGTERRAAVRPGNPSGDGATHPARTRGKAGGSRRMRAAISMAPICL
jgi:NAD(P)-dependent dehydrogenase (short-subunit alcohol dehydrogenase family)